MSTHQATEFRRLLILIAVNFVDMIGFAIVLPLLPFYALELHASPRTIGGLIASYSVAQLLAAPLWGRVSDHRGRRPALLIGLFASAAAYIVFGLASSLALLFLSRIVQGAGGGTTGVAQAYVADTVPPERRAQALGWLSAATAAGIIVGPVVGSLATHLGKHAPGFIAAGLCLLNATGAWFWLPESRAAVAASARGARPPVWHAAWQVLVHPRGAVPRLTWIYAVGMLAFTCNTSVVALFLHARFGITEHSIFWFFTYIGTLSLVMRSVLLGPIVRRIGERGAMQTGAAILVLGLALYPCMPSLWQLVLVMPLVPIGTALLFPATTALMSRATPTHDLGTTMGTAQTFGGIARVIAPIAATAAFEKISSSAPFFLAAALVACVSLLAWNLAEAPPSTDQVGDAVG